MAGSPGATPPNTSPGAPSARSTAPRSSASVRGSRRRCCASTLPAAQVEYKLRRLVNDYLQPPKVTRKMELGLQRIQAIAEDLERIKADNPTS